MSRETPVLREKTSPIRLQFSNTLIKAVFLRAAHESCKERCGWVEAGGGWTEQTECDKPAKDHISVVRCDSGAHGHEPDEIKVTYTCDRNADCNRQKATAGRGAHMHAELRQSGTLLRFVRQGVRMSCFIWLQHWPHRSRIRPSGQQVGSCYYAKLYI